MFAKAFYPVRVGTPIKLKVLPIDPRDLFRGNYVNLNYDFSRIDLDSVKTDLDSVAFSTLTYGDALFVELALDSNNEFYETVGLWQDANKKSDPATILLKGTRRQGDGASWNNSGYNTIAITAGIESFFTNKENALSLEDKMRPNWSFNPDKEEYIVWSEVYVTDEGAVRMSNIDFKRTNNAENDMMNFSIVKECNENLIKNMYSNVTLSKKLINKSVSLLELENNSSSTNCYSDSYVKVIRLKTNELDTLYLTTYSLNKNDFELIESDENLLLFSNCNSPVGYFTFYILDLNANNLFVSKIFEEYKATEKDEFVSNYKTIYSNFTESDTSVLQVHKLEDLNSITSFPTFKEE
jgi:uncharacterized membrane-anchored protein